MDTAPAHSPITLAFIHGNTGAALMRRFLTHFRPLVERFIAVRASGGNVPDDTESAFAEFPVTTYRYENAPEHADWPHVDDFAAARNLAFDKAFEHGAEWVMWADTDDTIAQEDIDTILHGIREAGATAHLVKFWYRIPDQDLTLMRERIVRNGIARWQSPCHEAMQVADPKMKIHALEIDAQVVHVPDAKRDPRSSNLRNIRILESIPEAERTTSHRYHLMQEHRAAGNTELADQLVRDFLKHPASGRVERFEGMVTLAVNAKDLAETEKWFWLAHREMPERRDSIGELAHIALASGRIQEALALTRSMMALPMPEPPPWNLRRKFWGAQGLHLHTMALRMAGQKKKADVLELNHFIEHGGLISLLHATRGRPGAAARARQVWFDRAEDPDAVEHIFGIDHDDAESDGLSRFRHVSCLPNGGCVAAWNKLARAARGRVLIQVSDDFEPPLHWDRLIISAFGGIDELEKPAVLAVSDGHRTDKLLCMAIVTRARLKQQQGYLFHPAFLGVYSDNWFTDVAYDDGAVIEARDIVFKHHHPAFNKDIEADATYTAQNSPGAYTRGKMVYDRLRAGVLTWPEVTGWCNYSQLYESFAKFLQDGDDFVEVGCWMGQSIICLAQKLQELGKNGVRLHAVDTWQGEAGQPVHEPVIAAHGGSIRAVFEANIRASGVADMITLHESDSAAAAAHFADAALAGIFIDAAHEYEPVCRDLRAWQPKVRPGGIFAGHDIHHPPVRQALADCAIPIAEFGACWVRGNGRMSNEGKPT